MAVNISNVHSVSGVVNLFCFKFILLKFFLMLHEGILQFRLLQARPLFHVETFHISYCGSVVQLGFWSILVLSFLVETPNITGEEGVLVVSSTNTHLWNLSLESKFVLLLKFPLSYQILPGGRGRGREWRPPSWAANTAFLLMSWHIILSLNLTRLWLL